MATEEIPVSPEQLHEAEQKHLKAIELRDKDPDSAIELLGQVLEIRNKAYGEKSLECADVYLYYGELLFEQAQASTDYLGDQMKSAAMQRAKQIASEEAAGEGDDAAQDEPAEGDAAGDMEAEEAEVQPLEAEAPSEPPTTDAAPATADADMLQAADGDVAAPAAAPAAVEPAEGEQDGPDDEDGEQEDDEDDSDAESESDGEDVDGDAAEAAEGKAEEQQEQQVTGESDDMALAWEMLEMARLIYGENGGEDKYASKLADCHMYIGDILAEQEKFEEGVQEYSTALEMLAKVDGGLSAVQRRAAELEFKRSTALQLSDQPAEALKAIHSAQAHLQARLNELTSQLASKAGSSGASSDAAGAAAFAAFASVLSSYKPAEADDSKDSSQPAADAALQQEVADLRSVIESMTDRIDELKAAVEAHEDMRETIRKTFAAAAGQGSGGAAAGGAGSGDAADAGAAGGPTDTIGFGSAAVQAGPVQDIGVIGKGKRVAPVPVAGAAVSADDGGKKRPLSDVSNSEPDAAAVQDTDSRKEKVQAAGEVGEAKRMKA